MNNMIALVQVITAVWLLVLAILAMHRLARGKGGPAHVLTCIHFVFFGVPIWLDLIVGQPDVMYPGFLQALGRPDVELAYCGVVSVAPLVWQSVAGSHAQLVISPLRRRSGLRRLRITPLEMSLLALPVILTASLGDLSLYSSYGAATLQELDVSGAYQHALISLACMLVIATVASVVGRTERLNPAQTALLMAAVSAAFWLQGKRLIIAVAALWIGYALWGRSRISVFKLGKVCAVLLVTAASLVAYQWLVRGLIIGQADSYSMMRVEYGRDLVLKQTLLSELRPAGPQVLEYRGQSIAFYAAAFVPREVWPDKPWPYAVYQTSRMLSKPPGSIGWGITTSWLDESIANFGWLGVLVGPLFLGMLCRIGLRSGDPVVEASTVVVTSLFLTVHLAAFFAIFIWWCCQVVVSYRRKRLGRVRRPFGYLRPVLSTWNRGHVANRAPILP